jgi:hypothetical protein
VVNVFIWPASRPIKPSRIRIFAILY